MKILKAKIKKSSEHYAKGLNQKNKAVWLRVLNFTPEGEKNYQIEAVKEFKNNEVKFCKIWLEQSEITLKQFDDGQLKLWDFV